MGQRSLRHFFGVVALFAILFGFYRIDAIAFIASVTVAASWVCVLMEIYRYQPAQRSLIATGFRSAFLAAILYGGGRIAAVVVQANSGEMWAATEKSVSPAIFAFVWCVIAPFVGASIALLASTFLTFFNNPS